MDNLFKILGVVAIVAIVVKLSEDKTDNRHNSYNDDVKGMEQSPKQFTSLWKSVSK